MMSLLGRPLDEALAYLKEAGVDNVRVQETKSPRNAPEGTPRVVRVSEEGRALVIARFPDQISDEGEL